MKGYIRTCMPVFRAGWRITGRGELVDREVGLQCACKGEALKLHIQSVRSEQVRHFLVEAPQTTLGMRKCAS